MNGLRIKFGLSEHEPTEQQARSWARRTRELLSEGFSSEEAGARAAREIFKTLGTRRYASEGDTIYDLLDAIERGRS